MDLVGPDEVETPARLATVVDRQGEALAALEFSVERYAQAFAIVVHPGYRLSIHAYPHDSHVHGVKLDLVQAVPARGQGKTRTTLQGAGSQVGFKGQADMADRDRAVGNVMGHGAGGGERSGHGARASEESLTLARKRGHSPLHPCYISVHG